MIIKLLINWKKWLLIIGILFFIVLKLTDLTLPCLWDEAWSYYPVIHKMALTQPTLFPNDTIIPELYRGHPLLFYFLSSLWMKVFGLELWIAKLFALFIAISYLISLYVFASNFFNQTVALISVILVSAQSVFFVQSSLLLPEIMLALFTLWTLYFYLEKKPLLTALFLILALYTKESAVVLWVTVFFFEVIKVTKTNELSLFKKAAQLYLWFIPLIVIFLFYYIQYSKSGWFFFPEHINFISLSGFTDKLIGYLSYLFIYHGRNILTFSALIATIILLYRRSQFKNIIKNEITLISVFIFLYLIFSSLNFYSPRYILSILPLTIVIFVFVLYSSSLAKIIKALIFTLIIINTIYSTAYKGNNNDHTLGSRDLISVHQQAISFCENKSLQNNTIYAPFLISNYLTKPELGYLKKKKPFTSVSNQWNNKIQFALISCVELDDTLHNYLKVNHKLLKRFDKKKSWVEMYEITN